MFFQIPLIIYILIKKNIIKYDVLFKNRKKIYIFYLIASAIIAPPDLINQLIIYSVENNK